MLIYDSGKYILEYIYSLYNSIFDCGKYLYNLLFSTDYKYDFLNDKNNSLTSKSILNSERFDIMSESSSCVDNERIGSVNSSRNNRNYITRINSDEQIEAASNRFSDLSNNWKCSVCGCFNSISISICNDCQIDTSSVPFLHEIVNEISNHTNLNISPNTLNTLNTLNLEIKILSPTTHLIKDIIDELIDRVEDQIHDQSIVKNDSANLSDCGLSDWECI